MKTITIAGGTGFIGSAIAQAFADDFQIQILTRRPEGRRAPHPNMVFVGWDDASLRTALTASDIIINLAGTSLASRFWTSKNKRLFTRSRVDRTAQLANTIVSNKLTPELFMQGSAIGIYGSRGDEELTESSPPGDGFLADMAIAWEQASDPVADAGIRRVLLRTGLVLHPDGGLMGALKIPFKLFLGGHLGRGHNWVSWVDRGEMIRMIRFLIDHSEIDGPVNIVNQETMRGKVFYKMVAKRFNRPSWVPVPAFLLKLLPGGMGDEFLLPSQRVYPTVLTSHGFEFNPPDSH